MSTILTEPRSMEKTMSDPDVRARLEAILHAQRSGVLATCFMDIPLCSQMAFAADEDLRALIVVTPRQTTKYDNMSANPNVSFLVSTARNDPTDPAQAQALTVTAFATELDGERRHRGVTLFTRKHPNLTAFATGTGNAVMELRIGSYFLVDQFQQVTRISMG
jgi:nitroimidazol reductase NimA-like FMN-containing flavoprotein (pyridoxamine 5'-phosphate oxidase superfamily)